MNLKTCILISGGLFLAACSEGPLHALPHAKQERLDVLTSFTLALSKRDFHTAAAMLSPSDRGRIVDNEGDVEPQFKERLRAMRLTTMLNNPLIEIENGKVRGVFDILPVLVQAPSVAAEPSATSEPAEYQGLEDGTKPDKPQADPALRRTAEAFFKSVRAQNWKVAMGMVDPLEVQDFVKSNGDVREETRRRLAAIDTSAWSAMALRDGKLTGVVLLLPDPPL